MFVNMCVDVLEESKHLQKLEIILKGNTEGDLTHEANIYRDLSVLTRFRLGSTKVTLCRRESSMTSGVSSVDECFAAQREKAEREYHEKRQANDDHHRICEST